jgi:hypothetical protein
VPASVGGTSLAATPGMANEPRFKNAEEQEIARGGKATALWTVSLALLLIAGGVALTLVLREYVSPPARPGTTSATTTAGEVKPPSP